MALDPGDLKTETFTNARGWTVVRVTHLPSGVAVERARSEELQSPVHAQTECVRELEGRVAQGEKAPADEPDSSTDEHAPVTRGEFDALAARVARLERERKT